MKVENLEDLYELSPLQQGMLFQSLYAPQSGVYCLQLSCILQGDLDVRAFVRAWEQVLERHPILRSSFIWEEIDKPLQVVHRRLPLPLEERDWRALSATEQASRFQSLLEADRQHGFDLSTAPLMRLALIRVAEDSHRLIWSFHHVLLDGWSVSLLFEELFAFYNASAVGEPLHLQRRRPFRDYISWLQQQDLSQAEAFWRESLKDFNTPTPLSLERSSISAGEESSYDEHRFKLPESITNTLQRFTRQHQLTINTLVQGAWALLLNRYSGEKDIVFGVTTAGRPADLQGAENMIGLFINTLPARVEVPDSERILIWLKRLQHQQAEARHYEYTPLAHAQRWSGMTAGGPLFKSIVVFENYPVADTLRELSSANKLEITDLRFRGQTEYPLTVVAAVGRELTLNIGYVSSRFNKSAIERMAGHLQVLLNGILTNPDQAIAELPLLTNHERHQLLSEWNDTQQQYPSTYIHELFAAQVERTPDATAVVYEGERLSYRELNERANQLAHNLRVGPESLVGVMLERSTEMVISLLAVLKAGGAYLPLDPEYPPERLSLLLQDAQVTVVLTQTRFIEALATHEVRTVCVDAEVFATESRKNPESTLSADNRAYVIYTSGSTGTPKGAMNTHGALTNRLLWMQQKYSLTNDDVVLQKTPFSFDVSVWEFFWPLITGAQLVVARPGGHRDPVYLREVIERTGVTTLHFVPSMLAAFLNEPEVEQQCGSVRRVICSGEAFSVELEQRCLKRLAQAELHNLYGPTEAAIDVTSWTCERESERGSVPIGQPIANTRIYILDDKLRVAPVGVNGELYIGGVAVGRGYLGRAELTAERYIPDLYSGEGGARLYRTGDVCRWASDGQIEYLGRNDEQVKVRGHRIELAEVESALRGCDGVRECVVVAAQKDQRLIAYVVVGEAEPEVSVSVWRKQLEQRLPEYMIPAVFVKLEEMPLTVNGKLDRRALPQVKMDRSMLRSAYMAPYTLAEELLVGIWSEVLNVEQVGVLDNYFELGGDSIRSIQIFAKAQQVGLSFSIQQLFEHPTIRQLARVAGFPEAEQPATTEINEFSLIPESDRQNLPDDVEDAYPLTPLQAGMVFHSEYRPAAAIYHEVFSFHIKALFDSEILRTILHELLARHPVLRTSFDLTHFSEPLQLVRRGVPVPLTVDDLSLHSPELQEELLAAWIETERGRPFDWAQAPLVRFYVHLRSEKSFQFTLSFHHAVLDGWSVTSMLTEIFRHYASQLRDEPAPLELTPPVAKFRDFVALERATLESEECRHYWNEKLRNHTFLKIPQRHSSPQSFEGTKSRTHEVPIFSELSRKLFEVAREASVPLKSVLLAAHLLVMRLLGGQTDVLTGLVSNGRSEMTDGERVLGLFLNALPFRLQLNGGTWIDLLQATFAAERELLPFRRYPIAQIQREQGGQALFEAGFNFNHFHLFESIPKFAEIEMVDSRFFGATNYPLTANFSMATFPSEIQLVLAYNAGELSDEQVIAYGNYYATALDLIANSPSTRYEHANLLTDGERHQQLYEWNDRRSEYPSRCLHELFEAQVERTPDNTAFVFAEERLGYRELNERANQLAHYLQRLGVGPESLVGILMERSVEMIVSVLGVLKAGAAYVPLDPEYPRERLTFMLEDARVCVVLTQERWRSVVGELGPAVVCVESDWRVIQEQETANPQSGVNATNLAYVIYTSGSTGTPNGVLIEHHNITNLIEEARSIFAVSEESRVLSVSSFSFDASLLEMFLALTSGASLYLSSAEERLSIEELEELIEREQLMTAVLTPTWLQALAEERCGSLRVVSSGAERLSAAQARRWARGGRRLLNCYGPTEATVFGTYQEQSEASAASDLSRSEPGIGRGIGNVRVYVLDEQQQVVPVGVSGELYLGGAGVGRGYLSRADLTASRYVPDPYSGESGARMYRTGDVARWRAEGELEYVGRRDEQVKVRGQRVELGEVEAALREQEGVRECVVVAQESGTGEQRLLAYVVADQESPAFPSERIELCPSVAEYFVYDDYLYQTLTHDEKRNQKYRAVIDRCVKDRVVLDIGTGRDAILARLCVEAGARRVYAVEVLEESYRQAREQVRSLGLEDRIIVLHGDSRKISLPESVDVCVSEIVGSIGGSEGAALILNDARRFLTGDGVMIPERSVTRVAAVSSPDEVGENPGFSELSAHYTEQIFAEVGHRFDLRLCIRNFPRSGLLSESGVFEELDFRNPVEAGYRREIEMSISRKGQCDGLLVWMELEVGAGEVIDILEGGYSWYPVYFPIFDRGVEVEAGDRIVGECGGRVSGNGINPDYWIRGKVVRKDGGEEEFEYESKHQGDGYRERGLYREIFGEDGRIKRREERTVASRELREQLKQRLPEFMIPHSFVILDSLPLTPTGKIDRNSLPSPETVKFEAERAYVAPRTPLEQRLAYIWGRLLDVEQVGIHDNFFDLGGHSLLSTRLISHVRQEFALELPLRRLFEIPTIAMLATEIEKLKQHDDGMKEAAIKPLSRESRRMARAALDH